MKRFHKIIQSVGLIAITALVIAATITSTNFDTTQFATQGSAGTLKMAIKSGAAMTNMLARWNINGTFQDVWVLHDTHGIDLEYNAQDGGSSVALIRTVDGAITFPVGFTVANGASVGYVWTSDANGVGSWQAVSVVYTNNQFNVYITTNLFATFNATTINNTTINSTTVNTTDIHVSGKGAIGQLIVTNGFSPGFKTLLAPDSNKTNFIIDASQATYFTYAATNDVNVQYLTNTTTGVGISGASISLRILPNGANRVLNVNSNWVPLQTNIWTMVTSANPGYWQTTVTNATDGNGPRALLLSAACFDSTFNQTNVIFNALLSP